MKSFVVPELSDEKMHKLSTLSLAHIGDAVYELLIRTWLIEQGISTSKRLHSETIKYVSASAQSGILGEIMPELTESELAVYQRGRNSKPGHRAHSASAGDYNKATGLEALFGHLYLSGLHDRLFHLFEIITDRLDPAER